MKKPQTLSSFDFFDTVTVPCGYDLTSVPDITRDNFQTLIDEHNNLVECFNKLCEKQGLDFNAFEGES